MHVIAKGKFVEASKKYPSQKQAIMDTYKTLCKAAPKDLIALQQVFASAERYKYLDDGYTINIGGNHVRLIAIIFFKNQKLLVKYIVSHAEYDKLNDRYRRGEL